MKRFEGGEKRPNGAKSFVEMLNRNDGRLLSSAFKASTTMTTTTMLDSSGNESDSSEELLYGPGFVSRLKSRYMSVAIRGSSGYFGKSGSNRKRPSLRRTASFEEFLEKERLRSDSSTKSAARCNNDSKPAVNHFSGMGSSGKNNNSNKCDSKSRESIEESFKRCQSVEVLTSESTKRLDSVGRRSHIESVLDSLANDNICIEEADSGRRNRHQPKHRRSVPLLFGVQVRELPSPDTVRETRRLFEPQQPASESTMSGQENNPGSRPGLGGKHFDDHKSSPSSSSPSTSTRPNVPLRPPNLKLKSESTKIAASSNNEAGKIN